MTIFVECANGDLLIFDSAEEAERAVESPDVEAGEYTAAFDATGRALRFILLAPTKRRQHFGVTSIELAPVRLVPVLEQEFDPNALRRLLVAKVADMPPDAPLATLVEHALRILHQPDRKHKK